jgi:uncharacterized protein YdaU (DUF1376 family)
MDCGGGSMSTLRTPHPYLPIYPGDILRDTLTWTGEQRALLLLLMVLSFIEKLPADNDELARITQYDPIRFRDLWRVVGQVFVIEDGRLLHPRVEAARTRADQLTATRKKSSAKGVAARKAKKTPLQVTQDRTAEGEPNG